MNIKKNPKFDFKPLSDFSGSGESVEMIIMVAMINHKAPRATTDQILVAENIEVAISPKNSISLHYARCEG